jgi:MYXO-CTERM domain-containing protein
MNRAVLLAAGVAASMTVAGPAAAYVPSRTDGGIPKRWPESCVPMVAYPNDLVAMMPIDEILGALDASAVAWSAGGNPCTYLQITVARSADEVPRAKIDGTNNIIFRTTSWCKQTDTGACDPLAVPYEPSALALTSVSASVTSGIIRDVDMEVNAFGFRWADLVTHPELRGMSIHDLQNAVTHEMGHVIGLDHTCFLNPPPLIDDMGQPTPECVFASPDVMATTMFPSANPGDLEKRTLAADDMRGLCETYPAAQDPRTCGDSMDDGCSCGAAGTPASAASSMVMVAAALAALRARRRRRA